MKKILLLIVFVSLFMLTACNFKFNEDTSDYGLTTVSDEADLKSLLKKSSNNGPSWLGGSVIGDTAENAAPEENKSNDYTKTNVQVEGVDEGDIMKTDGSRIYTISWDRLQVIKLLGDGQMELLLNEKITSDVNENNYSTYTYYSELYVTDDYLIVIGQKYSYSYIYYDIDGATKDDVTEDLPFYYNYTAMSVIYIYDIDTLEKIDNYEISGYELGSRLIDNRLYLISNHYIYLYNEQYDFDVRPWYKHNNQTSFFAYEDIKYIPDTIHQSFTIISTINLEKDNIEIDNNVFLSTSSWGQIYVSTTSIYFASTYYDRGILGAYSQKGMIISYQFSKETGKVFFGGYGSFEGYVINQFAIDEYNGFLRLATTDGWSGDNVKNRLYIFKRTFENEVYKLERISLIDSGLGKPGERIQSVRFNKDIATIVTFLRTDPLYTVDLSNPYKPIIAGELEVPGFSTYQHPWTDNLIVGIGFEADKEGRTTGMKISLYDITDINNPKEVGKPLVFQNNDSSWGWSFSEATYNHKAIMIDKTRNSLGFSINRYNWVDHQSSSDYIVLDVDATREQPIQIKHTISHTEYADDYWWNYNYKILRAFRVDNYIYAISNEVITSHNLTGDLSTVDEIIFKQYYEAK